MALLLGLLLGNLNASPEWMKPGMGFAEKRVLEAAIILLGFGLNIRIFSELGWSVWGFVGASVVAVLVAALLVGRWLGLSSGLCALLGAGSAICGSAAIGAVSPLLHSKEEETGLSIGIINLLGTLGLLLLPVISTLLAFSTESSAMMIGGILQSMGHVVGAAFSMSPEVGTLATIIKMGRIVLLIPLMLGLFFIGQKSKPGGQKVAFPLFIPLFLLALGLAQLSAFPPELAGGLSTAGDYLLVMAMVGIGYKIRIQPLLKMAGPALLAGALIFIFQILIYLAFLMS